MKFSITGQEKGLPNPYTTIFLLFLHEKKKYEDVK
jgi:hypothetical protein